MESAASEQSHFAPLGSHLQRFRLRNILFHDRALTAEMRLRKDAYLAQSQEVTAEMVVQWPMTRRL